MNFLKSVNVSTPLLMWYQESLNREIGHSFLLGSKKTPASQFQWRSHGWCELLLQSDGMRNSSLSPQGDVREGLLESYDFHHNPGVMKSDSSHHDASGGHITISNKR